LCRADGSAGSACNIVAAACRRFEWGETRVDDVQVSYFVRGQDPLCALESGRGSDVRINNTSRIGRLEAKTTSYRSSPGSQGSSLHDISLPIKSTPDRERLGPRPCGEEVDHVQERVRVGGRQRAPAGISRNESLSLAAVGVGMGLGLPPGSDGSCVVRSVRIGGGQQTAQPTLTSFSVDLVVASLVRVPGTPGSARTSQLM
jgi:hypothetical protein